MKVGIRWSSSRRRPIGLAAVLALVLVGTAVLAVEAGASRSAFPGKNGRIVFNDQTGSLVLVNPDGTGLVRLARTGTPDQYIGGASPYTSAVGIVN